MAKLKFVVRQYNDSNRTAYAIFRAKDVGSRKLVTWKDGIEPFRGYSDLDLELANSIKQRLDLELL